MVIPVDTRAATLVEAVPDDKYQVPFQVHVAMEQLEESLRAEIQSTFQ